MEGTGATLLFLLGMALLQTAVAGMTKCQKKRQEALNLRQSLKGMIQGYTPDCDEHGSYKPVQCSSSSGHCWCVTSDGVKVSGTDTPPGSGRLPNCDNHVSTELTKCQIEYREALNLKQSLKGTRVEYIPDCDELGNYKPVQCDSNNGYCWCVTTDGVKVFGTDTPTGQHGLPNCDSHGMTKCQKEHKMGLSLRHSSKGVVIGYIPDCDELGNYKPVQCDSSNGFCWCVYSDGVKVSGTETPPGWHLAPNCDGHGMTKCQKEYREALNLKQSIKGKEYREALNLKQSIKGKEYREALNLKQSIKGKEYRETLNLKQSIKGKEYPEALNLKQEMKGKEDREALNLKQSIKGMLVGYIPDCDEHGNYKTVQCSGSSGYCWCVTSDGVTVSGTETPPGSDGPPNCDSHGITKCQKERQEAFRQQYRIPVRTGIFVPDCDEHGNYEPLQCIGSSGYCWCVTSDGEKIPGTKSLPGRHGPPTCERHGMYQDSKF